MEKQKLPPKSAIIAFGNFVVVETVSQAIADATVSRGDFNRDGHVDAADVLAMELALANLPTYQSAKGLSNSQLLEIGNVNGDTEFTGANLQALLTLLQSGGGSTDPIPEPSTFVLAVLAFGMLWCRFRYCLGHK